MKKLLLGTLFLITGCVSNGVFSPSKTILNPKCEDVYQEIKVFQVLDSYVLGDVCREKYEYSGICSDSIVVYLKKDKGAVYYDDQKIQVPDGKCISYSSSYTYETRNYNKETKSFDKKTVPVVKFVDAEISNPEYTKWEKEQQKSEK